MERNGKKNCKYNPSKHVKHTAIHTHTHTYTYTYTHLHTHTNTYMAYVKIYTGNLLDFVNATIIKINFKKVEISFLIFPLNSHWP